MLDDTPHSIALGTTLGMFIGTTPTVGIQMVLVVIASFVLRPFFRFNRIAALLTVYVSNPLTMVPLYWMNYKVGTWFVEGNVTYERFARILEYDGFGEWWGTIGALVIELGWPLLVGSLVVATTSAAITYPLMRWLIASFHNVPMRIGSVVSTESNEPQGEPDSTAHDRIGQGPRP